MKIGIDARFYQEAGIGRYIRNLIKNLALLDRKNEYFIFLLDKDFNKVNLPENFHKVRANFGWYGLQEQIRLPRLLDKYDLDLIHFPHFNIPIFYRGKFVVTIHDLIHQHFNMQRATTHGSLSYKLKQLGYKKVFQHAIKKSSKILVPSQFVKGQLVSGWNVDSDKIVVTPEAVDDKIFSIKRKVKRGVPSPYIFYLGNAHPHKNVEGLIKAYLLLKKKNPNLNLVLSGQDHYFWERVKIENQQPGIIYTGYVTDEEAIALLKSADVYVQPSFEEGFGLPLLEAFAVGTPVVSSNAGSLPEVGGEASLYFNPYSVDDMADIIAKVLGSEDLQKNLTRKGLERVKQFSWEKLAKQTLQIYESCHRP